MVIDISRQGRIIIMIMQMLSNIKIISPKVVYTSWSLYSGTFILNGLIPDTLVRHLDRARLFVFARTQEQLYRFVLRIEIGRTERRL